MDAKVLLDDVRMRRLLFWEVLDWVDVTAGVTGKGETLINILKDNKRVACVQPNKTRG